MNIFDFFNTNTKPKPETIKKPEISSSEIINIPSSLDSNEIIKEYEAMNTNIDAIIASNNKLKTIPDLKDSLVDERAKKLEDLKADINKFLEKPKEENIDKKGGTRKKGKNKKRKKHKKKTLKH